MHILNVAFGGTLHQHLPDMEDRDVHGDPTADKTVLHDVRIAEGSLLGKVLEGDRLRNCASHHHQAVDRIGEEPCPRGMRRRRPGRGSRAARERGLVGGRAVAPRVNADEEPAQQKSFDAFAEQVRERRPVGSNRR